MKVTLLSIILLTVALICQGQTRMKSPGLMLGSDSTVITMQYSNFNNQNQKEYWEKISMQGRIIFYCKNSEDKNKSNVAHVYDFDENGINVKYTTISTQEKTKYAVDYFNNLAYNWKNIYKFQGINQLNQAVWIADEKVTELAGCDCGNVVVTLIANLNEKDTIVENCLVKPGKSGELLAIVYTPY